jgi:glycosyltransferase involved in cell wall biosynthesis
MNAVTHLLPVYNAQKYLPGSILRILEIANAQDQVLIVDDGSSDDTLQNLHKIAASDPRIEILALSHVGLISALNSGFERAKFNWVVRYDVDDHYSLVRLQEQFPLLQNDVAVVFSDYSFYLGGKFFSGRIRSPLFNFPTLCSLVYSQQTAHPSAIINKHLFKRVGGYLQSEYPIEDLGLWFRLSSQGRLVSSGKVLLNYRLDVNSLSGGNRKSIQAATRQIILKFFNSNFHPTDIDLSMELSRYRKSLDGYERKLLFLRNMRRISIISPKVFSKDQKKKIAQGFLNPIFILILAKLFFFSTVRYSYRKIGKLFR